MKLIVVGDIHGCYSELMKLMDLIRPRVVNKPAVICFLGDYVDRGPKSKEVLEYLIEFDEKNLEPVFLRGNHEDMMMRYTWGIHGSGVNAHWKINGGTETMNSYGGEVPNDIHRKFLVDTKMTYRHWFGDKNVVCVHAGIDPRYRLKDQSPYDMLWNRDFDRFQGIYKDTDMVIRGHTPLKGKPMMTGNQINIDTGAVFGYNLTAIEIRDIDDYEFIQVKSSFQY